MPLGYGYKERDATSYVDWGAIGKNLSDMLLKEKKDREDKKAALDAEQRATQNLLEQPPQGQDASYNEYTLRFTDDLKKASLLNYKLLKSGDLDPKDWTIKNQNLKDGITTLFNLSKEYQDQYKAAMDDYLSADPDKQLQDLTPFLMSHVEGYANFLNTKPIINQNDYTVTVAKMKFNKEKGIMEMSKDPNDFSSVSMLSNMIKQKYKKFNVDKSVGSYVNNLGEKLDTVIKMSTLSDMGSVTEIFDQTKRKNLPKDAQGTIMNFEKAETAALTSLLATPFDYTSILTNSIKTAPNQELYNYTWNEEEAKKNNNLILLKVDPQTKGITPQLTEDQKKAAIEHLRVQARLMYDEKAKVTQIISQKERRDRPAYMVDQDKSKIGSLAFGRNLFDAASGGPDQIGAALAAMDTALGKVKFDKTGSSISYTIFDERTKKPERVSFTIPKGNSYQEKKSFADAVAQLAKQSGYDPDIISNEFMRLMKNKSFNTTDVGSSREGGESSGGASKFNSGSNFNWTGPFANPQ